MQCSLKNISFFDLFKNKNLAALNESIVGNFVGSDVVVIPSDGVKKVDKDQSVNLLQNVLLLNKIDLNQMKKDVLINFNDNIKVKTNLPFIFSNKDMYNQLEEQIRNQIKFNGIEMVIIGETVIANKFIKNYEKLKQKIPEKDREQILVFHGTRLRNHYGIVEKHFFMPNVDKEHKAVDGGYFGKGITATDNLIYASTYSEGFKQLKINESTHVIACIAVYNKSYVKQINDLSYYGKKISSDITNNFGIHYALSGSSMDYTPIPESQKDQNFIAAGEYIFPNKYQIIPLFSLNVKRTDHLILMNIERSPDSDLMQELKNNLLVNVYSAKSNKESLKIINMKKRNKVKLIIKEKEDDCSMVNKKLIDESRKIMHCNFVCIVFSTSKRCIEWISKMDNVLFTTEFEDVKKFATINLNEKSILDFSKELERKYQFTFKLNQKELLSFPTTFESFYKLED